ncbi:hypothetical protein FQN57_002526 [Myotisia sp. PD_48]|nr:hypothetical protein FQN57_002526 [Myotisia sp. PD_48]
MYPRPPTSPLFFEPLDSTPADNIVEAGDSDGDGNIDDDARAAKKRRIERLAQNYLEGKPLFISTATLRGPFDDDWVNPWKKQPKRQPHLSNKPPIPARNAFWGANSEKLPAHPLSTTAATTSKLTSKTKSTATAQRSQNQSLSKRRKSSNPSLDPQPDGKQPTRNRKRTQETGIQTAKLKPRKKTPTDWLKRCPKLNVPRAKSPTPTPLRNTQWTVPELPSPQHDSIPELREDPFEQASMLPAAFTPVNLPNHVNPSKLAARSASVAATSKEGKPPTMQTTDRTKLPENPSKTHSAIKRPSDSTPPSLKNSKRKSNARTVSNKSTTANSLPTNSTPTKGPSLQSPVTHTTQAPEVDYVYEHFEGPSETNISPRTNAIQEQNRVNEIGTGVSAPDDALGTAPPPISSRATEAQKPNSLMTESDYITSAQLVQHQFRSQSQNASTSFMELLLPNTYDSTKDGEGHDTNYLAKEPDFRLRNGRIPSTLADNQGQDIDSRNMPAPAVIPRPIRPFQSFNERRAQSGTGGLGIAGIPSNIQQLGTKILELPKKLRFLGQVRQPNRDDPSTTINQNNHDGDFNPILEKSTSNLSANKPTAGRRVSSSAPEVLTAQNAETAPLQQSSNAYTKFPAPTPPEPSIQSNGTGLPSIMSASTGTSKHQDGQGMLHMLEGHENFNLSQAIRDAGSFLGTWDTEREMQLLVNSNKMPEPSQPLSST